MAETASAPAAPAPAVADTTVVEKVEEKKFTFLQACGMNTMMMFGTGPFISIPYCIAATNPAGPQALVGYSIAALGCMCDSFIWGELGSRFPMSGGSYVYLRECFGRDTYGKLAAFIYTWQFWVSAPAEIASGFLAISEYLVFIHGNSSYECQSLTALGLLIPSIGMLCLGNGEIGKFIYVMWAITLAAIAFVLIGGFANFDSTNFQLPPQPFGDGTAASLGTFVMSLGAACRFGVYDFTGYYDVCQMGGEVEKPKRTIPGSCIITCGCVLVIYILTYVSVIGYVPWYGPDGFVALVEADDGSAGYIMSMFAEKIAGGPGPGKGFGIFFSIIVVITIFGSVFSMFAGMIYLPGAAAEDGMFFKIFTQRSNMKYSKDRPLVSLFCIGVLSAAWCFFSLDTVIDAMTSMLVLVQFLGQAVGLCVLRYRIKKGEMPEDEAAFKVKCLPLVAFVQMTIFTFIYCTTDNYIFSGNDPILDFSLLFVLIGVGVFFGWQKVKGDWPFKPVGSEVEITKEGKAVDVSTISTTVERA